MRKKAKVFAFPWQKYRWKNRQTLHPPPSWPSKNTMRKIITSVISLLYHLRPQWCTYITLGTVYLLKIWTKTGKYRNTLHGSTMWHLLTKRTLPNSYVAQVVYCWKINLDWLNYEKSLFQLQSNMVQKGLNLHRTLAWFVFIV